VHSWPGAFTGGVDATCFQFGSREGKSSPLEGGGRIPPLTTECVSGIPACDIVQCTCGVVLITLSADTRPSWAR